ncbi:hypothetical protein MRX96_026291 [Rhipicephalus microplus]
MWPRTTKTLAAGIREFKGRDGVSDSSSKIESDSRRPETALQDGLARPKNDTSVKNYVRNGAGSLVSLKDAIESQKVRFDPGIGQNNAISLYYR